MGETGLKCLHFSNTEKALRTDSVLRRDQNIPFYLLNVRYFSKTNDTYAFMAI
jgi:hypothetical protein